MSGEGGGLGDILSQALTQTGVEHLHMPSVVPSDTSMLLSAAAEAFTGSFLSGDSASLTEDLFSSLGTSQVVSATPPAPPPAPLLAGAPPRELPLMGFGDAEEDDLDFDLLEGDIDLGDLLACDDPSTSSLALGPPPPLPGGQLDSLFASTSPGLMNSYGSVAMPLPVLAPLTARLAQPTARLAMPMTPLTRPIAPLALPRTQLAPRTMPQLAPPITRLAPPPSELPVLNASDVLEQVMAPAPVVPVTVALAGQPGGGTPVAVGAKPSTMLSGRGVNITKEALEEDSDDDDEQFVAADTYANYRPAKLKLGRVHPDPIVESSSLSSVEPPQVWFDLLLPSHVVEEGLLSSLQLEAITYACQQHMNILADGSRSGYLVGDGAGVGKGRTIAGIIFQNYLEGRKKAIWLSVSNDLKYDAIRDFKDIGAKKIDVYSLNKFHYGKISGKRNGRVRKGVVFATYSSLIGESTSGGKYRTRFNQLLHWLGPHYEGVIVFDECHKAKNLVPSGSGKPSKTGLTVLQLQKRLPKARIVYCSATGASEPRNMAYMSRLGIWGLGTQFPSFQDFIRAVERRGVGAMEIVAMDMKLRGMYTARQLSFAGVTFSVEEVTLSEQFVEMYDAAVELWMDARKLFAESADLLDYSRMKLKSMWGQFWASHQRFFKYLCIAAKVAETVRLAKAALSEGKCVVIGLQSTGEARMREELEQNEQELTGFVSTCKGVLESLIRRHFPSSPGAGATLDEINWTLFDNDATLPRSCRKKRPRESRPPGAMFAEETFSDSDDDSTSVGDSDSAMESSSEGEAGDSEGGGARPPGSSSDESEMEKEGDEGSANFSLFGINESWLKDSKPKVKRRKLSPGSTPSSSSTPSPRGRKKHNYSILPPPAHTEGRSLKTGFNSRSLKFEPVLSPKEQPRPPHSPHPLHQQSSLAEGSATIQGHAPARRPSLQASMSSAGEGQALLQLMSNSLSAGTQPQLRNVAIKKMRDELLTKLRLLSPHLPANTLDELIDGLGGPTQVAEMTGRRGRVVSQPDGTVKYELRSGSDVPLEYLNITEKQRFMDGEKNIAIISEAASSGISLQADRRVKNHRRRVHITLELPWSADKAIQQFGRTHRSNQVSAPEYIFLISELSGEQRFASTVAKRLESLGALTHGDRRATETRDLSKYNVDTKYGRSALETVLKSIVGVTPPLVTAPEYDQEFFEGCRSALAGVGLMSRDTRGGLSVDKEAMNMSRFLNRILGFPVRLQNAVFAYFSDTLEAVMQQAKKMGRWDGGIFDFGASNEHVEIAATEEFVGDAAFGTATTQLHRIQVERGLSFSEAVQKLEEERQPGEGFYLSKRVRNQKKLAVLLKASDASQNRFMVLRPNTGLQSRVEKLSLLLKKYVRTDEAAAESSWTQQYQSSLTSCYHAFWQGRCKMALLGQPCAIGLRRRDFHVLAGSVLGVWTQLEGVFTRHASRHSGRMQIARVRTDRKRLVGILIPAACVQDLRDTLTRVAQQAAGAAEGPAA